MCLCLWIYSSIEDVEIRHLLKDQNKLEFLITKLIFLSSHKTHQHTL